MAEVTWAEKMLEVLEKTNNFKGRSFYCKRCLEVFTVKLWADIPYPDYCSKVCEVEDNLADFPRYAPDFKP
jgi:hypothetical protein